MVFIRGNKTVEELLQVLKNSVANGTVKDIPVERGTLGLVLPFSGEFSILENHTIFRNFNLKGKRPVNCYSYSILGTSAPQTTVQAQPPFVGTRKKFLKSWMIALLAVIGGLVFLVLICAIIACCCYRRRKKKEGILTVTSYSIGKAFVVCSYLGQHFNNFRLT